MKAAAASNKGLHQTGREGVAHFLRRGPVFEARPAGEARGGVVRTSLGLESRMGVSLWVRLKQEIPGTDPLQTDGKLLSKAMDILDNASKSLEVRPLSDFYSVSGKQAMAESDGLDLSEEEWEALADDHVWWPPADGLLSVGALLRWTEENGGKVQRPEEVIADLIGFRSTLEAAARLGIQFNIAVSP